MINNWLDSNTDPALEEAAKNKILMVQQFEDDVPAVIIIHDLVSNSVVYMSRRGLNLLGTTLEEIRIASPDYHARYFNEEDARYYIPKIMGMLEKDNTDEIVSFFQQVRFSEKSPWVWHLSSTKVFLREKGGRPRLIITLALPVDTEHPIATKVEKLLEENSFLHTHQKVFTSLTKREKQILKCMALGHSSFEIAASLHISETTANTHRRNIRKKIDAHTIYDITRFAQAFDLI
jgi:DNA-binding CsgD family transcriptional regulator